MKLLPAELASLLGNNAPGWGAIASHEVADVAMALIRHASEQPGADLERVEQELERILPDVPMVSLQGVVDARAFLEAVQAVSRVADERAASLASYLTAS